MQGTHDSIIECKIVMKYTEYAKQCSSNIIYPLSIAEGFQDGEIIPDDEEKTKAVLFWHYAGFAYISGNIETPFLETIYQRYFRNEIRRRFILITDDPKVIAFFSDKSDIELDRRVEYSYCGNAEYCDEGYLRDKWKCEYAIERITTFNYDRIHGKIIPAFSWSSKEQFLEKGFGYVALDGERVAAAAFSAAVSLDEVDIGIETDEQYRHRGLAKLLAARMCREILSIGKKPVWAHAISNEGSRRTAMACGFVEDRVNTVIRRKG